MSLIAFGSVILPETWNDYTQFAFGAKRSLSRRRKTRRNHFAGEVNLSVIQS
jgi:hypothetical protein